MQDAAAIVHGDIVVDAHGAGRRIDLDAAEIEDEAVAERAIDLVGVGRRGELRRRPEYGLADRLIESAGSVPGAQWPARGEAREGKALSGFERAATRPSANDDLRGRHVELRGRDAREPVAQAHGRESQRRRRPPARSGWNNCPTRSTRRRSRCPRRRRRGCRAASGQARRRRPAPARCDGPGPAGSRRPAPTPRRADRG